MGRLLRGKHHSVWMWKTVLFQVLETTGSLGIGETMLVHNIPSILTASSSRFDANFNAISTNRCLFVFSTWVKTR